jgi:hemoglobin
MLENTFDLSRRIVKFFLLKRLEYSLMMFAKEERFVYQRGMTLYEKIGGETILRQITTEFYRVMATLPETQGILKMHPEDLSLSEQKLFEFLSGWSGGPPLFSQKYGHPMLRARHLPFSIGKAERDQWMLCMVYAVESVGLEESVRAEFLHRLLALADHMRNQQETSDSHPSSSQEFSQSQDSSKIQKS